MATCNWGMELLWASIYSAHIKRAVVNNNYYTKHVYNCVIGENQGNFPNPKKEVMLLPHCNSIFQSLAVSTLERWQLQTTVHYKTNLFLCESLQYSIVYIIMYNYMCNYNYVQL